MNVENSHCWDSREPNIENDNGNFDDGITHAIIESYDNGNQTNLLENQGGGGAFNQL